MNDHSWPKVTVFNKKTMKQSALVAEYLDSSICLILPPVPRYWSSFSIIVLQYRDWTTPPYAPDTSYLIFYACKLLFADGIMVELTSSEIQFAIFSCQSSLLNHWGCQNIDGGVGLLMDSNDVDIKGSDTNKIFTAL